MSSPMRLRASVPYIKVNDFNTIFNSNPNQHSKKSNMMYISNRTIPQKIKNNNIRTSPSKNSIHARNLTPDDIIKQFAGSSKANFAKEKKIVTSLLYELNYLKNEFTLQFKNESNNKSNSRTQNIVNQKESEYKKRIELILQKAEQELDCYSQQLEIAKSKNKELNNDLQIMRDQKSHIESQLRDAELSISKINKRFEIFNELKPFYDKLVSELNLDLKNNFENEKPKMIRDIKRRKEEVESLKQELIDTREDINNIYKLKREEEIRNKKINGEFSNNLYEIESENKTLEEDYNKKIIKMKEDIESLSNFKEDNIKITNTFITIFNIFYPKLYLERDLIKKPKNIDLIPSDYKPNTYETDEVVRYINLMLKNSNEQTSGLLLREIVSYANMTLRNEINAFDKIKYDPVRTVNEIEKYISLIHNQNKELKDVIKEIQNQNDEEQKYIDELNLELQRTEKMYDYLHNKLKKFYVTNKNENDSSRNIKSGKFREKSNLSDEKNEKHKLLEDKAKKDGDIFLKQLEDNLNVNNRLKTENDINKKLELENGLQNFIDHANRLFFYRNHLDTQPREIGVYINAHKRMKQKINRLKRIHKNSGKFTSVEKAVANNFNQHINQLLLNIKK